MSPSPGRSRGGLAGAACVQPARDPASSSRTGQVKSTSWQSTRPKTPGRDHDQQHPVRAEMAEQEGGDQRPDVAAAAHRRAGPEAGRELVDQARGDREHQARSPSGGARAVGNRRRRDDQHVDGRQAQQHEPGRPAQHVEQHVGQRRARPGRTGWTAAASVGRLGARARGIGGVVAPQAQGEEEVQRAGRSGPAPSAAVAVERAWNPPERAARWRRPGELQAANPAGAWSHVRHLLIGRRARDGLAIPRPAFAGIAGRACSFVTADLSSGLGKIDRPAVDSSSSVGSFVWSLPDMSR